MGDGPECGPNTCEIGEVCCNESCGICAPPDGACTQEFCGGDGPECGSNTCEIGEVCCNESCGICAPPDGACTQEFCGGDGGGSPPSSASSFLLSSSLPLLAK